MGDAPEPSETPPEPGSGSDGDPASVTRRETVEEAYDFEHFSPADMAEMTVEEWEAAFDPGSWITGPELVDRVEADLRSRVARRELFAVVERIDRGGQPYVLAYTDAGYALVAPDGTVEGEGAVLRDVEPVVALCSMADYEVAEPPPDAGLPDPAEVAAGSGGLGHRLLLALAGVQALAGIVLIVAPLFADVGPGRGGTLLTTVVGLGFLFIGGLLVVLVANARLSDRFRAREYRERLRAAGVGEEGRPAFLRTVLDDEADGDGGGGAGSEAAGRTDGEVGDGTGAASGADDESGGAGSAPDDPAEPAPD